MKKIYTSLLSVALIGTSSVGFAQTTTFNYTGAVQTYVVPACVNSITIDARGAQGGGPNGGLGGQAVATVPVTPGNTLYIYVGGQPTAQLGAGGFNGGGATLFLPCGGGPGADGWPGGGASDVRTTSSLNDRMVVGGGGGGTGWSNGLGGAGGGTLGTDGAASWIAGTHGKGGTQVAGGLGGFYSGNGQSAFPGTFGNGGAAGPPNTYCTGGAGGGGWYGGGGGYVSAGGGGSSYISYPGSSAASTIAGTRAGNGVVTITAVSGLPASPAAVSGLNSLCEGSSATYTIATVPGATSYTWTVPPGATINSGQGTVSINVTFGTTSGNVAVTADNICGSSAATTFSVTVLPNPAVTANSTSTSICNGSSVTLTGGGAASYSWTSSVSDGVPFVPAATTTYTVTGTSGNGCTNTATISVVVNALPVVTASTTASAVCAGSSVTLSGNGASSYMWTSSVTDNVAFTPTATDTYTVTGTDANGCENTATVTVIVNPLPVVSLGADITQCGGTVTLDAGNAGAAFLWSNTSTSQTTTVSASAAYSVMVTDGNGCSKSDTIAVTINAIPAVALGNDVTQCGGNVTLDAGNSGASYQWNTTDTTQTITVVSSGSYNVTVVDANGCTGYDTVGITINTIPTVTATASSNTACFADGAVSLNGLPAGGTWSGPGVTGNTFTPATAGIGTHALVYSYTDSSGCSDTASVSIMVDNCMSIEASQLTNNFTVYPNPNTGTFTLSVNATIGDLQIEMTDMQGRVVYAANEQAVQSGFTRQIIMENISDGMYILRLTSATEMIQQKITIQK